MKEWRYEGLLGAAVDGSESMAKALINIIGADVNVRGHNRETPLMLAALNGHEKMVELLIENGANINARNKWRETARKLAVRQGHKKVAELLKITSRKRTAKTVSPAPL